MGFEYKATVGFGILIDEDDITDDHFLGGFDNFMEEGDFADWWDAQQAKGQYAGLEWEHIWSEPSGWIFIYSKDSRSGMYPRDDSGCVYELAEPDFNQKFGLEFFGAFVGETPKWYHVASAH